jgi:Right handed beta helix region
MHFKKAALSIFLAVLAITGSRAHSQANITENQTTYIYVDAQKGSDSNSGSTSAPLKTIQAAVNKANTNNQKKIGTKIIVNAGVYRETVSINPVSNQSTVPLTLQAATTGTAIIAASDVVKNWSADPSHSGAYEAPFAETQGTCSLPSGWPTNFNVISRHTEMAFVNGVPLTQVMSVGQMLPGTFYQDESSNFLHIWPAAGTNMQTAVVEAAKRTKTLSINGRSNVVVRGMVLRHAANCMNTSGATVTSSSNILIDQVQANWNNWGGLNISGTSNFTVQNSIASYNGGVGFQSTKSQNALYSFNETDYNNWRGAQAAFYDWGMGGFKLFQMRNVTVQNHYSYNNQAQGLWFDTDNKNITITNATLVGSYNAALQIERNEGPITLQNSHLASSGSGVNLLTSQKVTLKNNTFYNNGATNKFQAQIYLAGQKNGITISDWQTGQSYYLTTTGMVLSGNTVVAAASGQDVFGTYLSGADWSDFANTLNASNNTWYDSTTSNSFKVVNGKLVNLSGWQSTVGTDYSSKWAPPATSLSGMSTVPTTSFADFAVNLDNANYTMSSGKVVATARVNSFGYGSVSLKVTGLPSGVSASISNGNLVSGVATVTLTAAHSAANQTVPVTLWAVSGNRVHSVTFNVHVVPA